METKKKREGKLEREIQNEIVFYLKDRGTFFWRSNNIPVYAKNNAGKYMHRSLPKDTPKGLPDLIAIVGGNILCIEVKRENGGTLSEHQVKFGEGVRKAGGVYIVASSVLKVKDTVDIMEGLYCKIGESVL